MNVISMNSMNSMNYMNYILASQNINHYGPIAILVLMAIVFGVVNVFLSTFLGKIFTPSKDGPTKGTTYESGVNPIGSTHKRFNVRFYIVAMTFLVLDVEIVFLYPWGKVFPNLLDDSGLSMLFLGRMIFFVLTTVIGITYAWRKGIFSYD